MLIAALATLLIVLRGALVGLALIAPVLVAPTAILPDRAIFNLLSVEYELEILALVLLLITGSADRVRPGLALAAAAGGCVGAATLVRQLDEAGAFSYSWSRPGSLADTPDASTGRRRFCRDGGDNHIPLVRERAGSRPRRAVPVRRPNSVDGVDRTAVSCGDLPSTFFFAVFMVLALTAFGVVLMRSRANDAALAGFLPLPMFVVNVDEAYIRK